MKSIFPYVQVAKIKHLFLLFTAKQYILAFELDFIICSGHPSNRSCAIHQHQVNDIP